MAPELLYAYRQFAGQDEMPALSVVSASPSAGRHLRLIQVDINAPDYFVIACNHSYCRLFYPSVCAEGQILGVHPPCLSDVDCYGPGVF